MRKFLPLSLLILLLNCPVKHVESVVPAEGSVVNINSARFVIVEGSIPESTKIRIETFEAKGIYKRNYDHGFIFTGKSINIKPESLFFEKPMLFFMPVKGKNYALAAKIGKGFVPLAESKVEGETLQAKIWHGGEYYVIKKPERYGILNHSKTDSALLIVSDIYVSDYIKNFCKVLKQSGYDYPIWTYIYPGEIPIEENAKFLAEELKTLHEKYGKFRLDVVGFGIGGLITHRYVADTTLYQKDISSAIIAVGTPFFGSNFASLDSVKKGRSPYRFFFIDGMGENAKNLIPGSDFINWIRNNYLIMGRYIKDIEENKNFAAIRGRKIFTGELPEELAGDGIVSLASTMLTAIEPEPLLFDHFSLFENNESQTLIGNFLLFYRTFTWPALFNKVWNGEENLSKITEFWEKEVKLNLRKNIDFDILLEFNENMLKSAPNDAILITNGDNDTYPAWYLQEKGIRKDVLIVNWGLFNMPKYVHFLKNNGLPLEMTTGEIDSLRPYVDKKTKKIVYVSDQLIDRLSKQQKRPLVFSTTVSNPQRYGYPLKLTGLVYEIGEGEIDIERTKELLHKEFKFNKLFSTDIDSLSEQISGFATNYASSAFSLTLALIKSKRYEEALQEVIFAKRFSSPRQPFSNYSVLCLNEALIYSKLDRKEMTDSVLKEILKTAHLELEIIKRIAEIYFEMGMKSSAIMALGEGLKQHPDDKEIPDLIKKYQTE